MQLSEQAAPLGGVQTVDEVARALRRVQRLHGLLLGVGAQEPGTAGGPERRQPPAAAAPGRRAGRGGSGGGGGGGGGGGARPQAAHRAAPQQRQQPGHGAGARRDPRGSPDGRTASDAAGRRLRSWAQPGPAPGAPDAGPGRPAPCTSGGARAATAFPCPARSASRKAPSPGKLCARRPGRELGAGERAGGAGGRLPAEERRRGRAGGQFLF